MRKAGLAGLLLALAVLVQLSVLNGLQLPGGAVPDLVLILVAALAMAQGPLYGMVAGFAAGLAIDIAPPASQLIGQYALVFCLAGWAAGQLGRAAARSAAASVFLLGLVVAAGEALTAVLGLALEPAQVTTAQVRQVLPASIGYDLLAAPFLLYLVLLANSSLERAPARAEASGTLAVPARAKRTPGNRQPRQPRLAHAAARPGDGWVGNGPHRRPGSRAPVRPAARLRPAGGVPGSATGLTHRPAMPAAPVNLRLTGRRRRDGAIGNAVGSGLAGHQRQPGRHPGLLAGTGRSFRPHGGLPGGSAAARPLLTTRRPAGRTPIRFGGHRGDATVGRGLGTAGASRRGGPRVRVGASRMSVAGGWTAAVPRLRFSAARPPVTRRPPSSPRFRRRSDRLRISALTFGLLAGGALDEHAFRSMRRRQAVTPKLRLGGGRAGMLGGSGRGPRLAPRPSGLGALRRRGAGRTVKQPRFGYGKRSPLSVLSRSRFGGRWLATRRAGSRSGAWLIGKRTGGLR
jgi:rod shape-determining protein MreD